jgi:Fur family ferric uptake transcriptional regulator
MRTQLQQQMRMRSHPRLAAGILPRMKRMTVQRRAIQEALAAGNRPMSPEEILAAARAAVPGLNLATIYRNLNDLSTRGELVRVEVAGQPARYELSGLAHHHHFHCQTCDKVYDLPGCPKLPARLAPRGFKVTGHEFMLFGRCAACA